MKSSQTYNGLPIKIGCASLNFKKLDKSSLKILQSASFSDPQTVIDSFKKKLGFEVEQLSVIQKCNAVMVVIVSNQNISTDYLRNCIFDVWDKLSMGGIVDNLNKFVFYEDESAVKYIAECALGLNSVTIGDSQVFSQINNEIQASGQNQNKSPTLTILCLMIIIKYFGLKDIQSKIYWKLKVAYHKEDTMNCIVFLTKNIDLIFQW